MYTKNPVSGKNETIVNTSMLRGAIGGVVTKIADKADQSALEELSVYAENVAARVTQKADKAVVAAVSAYAEGMLPKDVYTPLVDAYVGLACKVADPDVLEGAAKMAHAANPVKYATSNPSDENCAYVSFYTYVPGTPIYDAVHAAGSTVELPPFLCLKTLDTRANDGITSWKTELPNLTSGEYMFSYCSGLESWDIELPNLTNGQYMFISAGLTSWTTELPNLTDGLSMFDGTGLTSFSSPLPSLHTASAMFTDCRLDIDSLRCIAEGINDVNNLSDGDHAITIGLSIDASAHPDKQKYVDLLTAKGWRVAI